MNFTSCCRFDSTVECWPLTQHLYIYIQLFSNMEILVLKTKPDFTLLHCKNFSFQPIRLNTVFGSSFFFPMLWCVKGNLMYVVWISHAAAMSALPPLQWAVVVGRCPRKGFDQCLLISQTKDLGWKTHSSHPHSPNISQCKGSFRLWEYLHSNANNPATMDCAAALPQHLPPLEYNNHAIHIKPTDQVQ